MNVDDWVKSLKSHKALAGIIAAGVAIVGIGKVAGALGDIRDLFEPLWRKEAISDGSDGSPPLSDEEKEFLRKLKAEEPQRFRPVEPQQESADAEFSRLWPVGSTINIAFLDGSEEDRRLVRSTALEWAEQANVTFSFVADVEASEARITFREPLGTYLGTDCLARPKSEPSMRLGLALQVSDTEEQRFLILHDFGHLLGLIHEHQAPNAKLPWKWEEVYGASSGPPNYWTRQAADLNLRPVANPPAAYKSKPFDPRSVMMYKFPDEWLETPLSGKPSGRLSDGDIDFIRRLYPPRA